MHLSSKNEKNDITDNGELTMLVKNASFLPENTTTLGGSGKEPEANTGSANIAAMKGSLKSIGTLRKIMKKVKSLRKTGRS